MTILHNSINGDSEYNTSDRTVLLHQHAVEESARFTTAHFDRTDVHLVQMRPDGKAKHLTLTPEEADALVAAYSQFKLDVEAAKLAAIQANDEAVARAGWLAREMRDRLGDFGTVEIKKPRGADEDVYTLSIPALNWTWRGPFGSDLVYTDTDTGLEAAMLDALRKVHGYVEDLEAIKPEFRAASWGSKTSQYESHIFVWHEHEAFFKSFLKADETVEVDDNYESSYP